MLSIIKNWIEIIFPERRDHRLVREASTADMIAEMTVSEAGGVIYLLPFSTPLVRAAIHEVKFKNNDQAASLLAAVLARFLKHQTPNTILIPIPLSLKRQQERGYNQVVRVVEKVLPAVKLEKNILFRQKDTAPQTTLARQERLINIKNAFMVINAGVIRGQHVILLDDVTTTGATLKEAAAVLEKHQPASLTLVALAH